MTGDGCGSRSRARTCAACRSITSSYPMTRASWPPRARRRAIGCTRSRARFPSQAWCAPAAAGATLGALAFPRLARAQPAPKIRVGYWPIAAGLPFYVAVEKGFFKEAGVEVEPIKFAGAQQVMEAMLSGRADGSANG